MGPRSCRTGAWGAWTRKTAGAIVLVAGTVLAVPAALAISAAPAAAVQTSGDTPTGVTATPATECFTDSFGAVALNGDFHPVCGTITVTKVDSITGAKLDGAQFTLYRADTNHKTDALQCENGPKDDPVGHPEGLVNPQVTVDGTLTFTPVFAGDYCVVETHAPDDYTASSDPIFVSITLADHDCVDGTTGVIEGEGHCGEGSSLQWVCVTEESHSDSAPLATNDSEIPDGGPQVCNASATVKNTPDPGTVQIIKAWVGGGTEPTDGAPFSLLASDSSVAGTCIANAANSNSCTIDNVTEGTYTLHESAVTGWSNANNDQTVPVKPGSLTIVDVTNNTVTIVPTAAAGGTSSTAAVSGATTVHTGEAFAGSAPYVAAMAAAGGTLIGFGLIRRRRAARQH